MSATLGYASSWQVSQWMSDLSAGHSYVSLHFSDPGIVQGNPSSTEVGGASYKRAQVVWAAQSARVLVSINAQEWKALPETVVTHYAIWDDPYGGHMRFVIPRVTPMYVLANGSFRLETAELFISWP